MKAFLDKEFLLNTETAKKLYHEAAEKQPIIDYHCHLNPREIWEDVRYENITQVWLGGDHYKWRLMRSAGVPEEMARSAIRELLLARESSSRSFAMVREATLVVRESCGAQLGFRKL